jgi:hemerythrin-like domain-containing protein
MSGLTELGQVLHEEHFRILVSICALENRVSGPAADDPLDPDRAEDKQQLEDLICALDDVLKHHAFEERVIFPLIRSGGNRELASILAREHGAIEPMTARLRAIASGILENGLDGQWAAFRDAATQLVDEVMRHLQKEELNIVQRMECFLDSETDHRLAIRLAAERGNGKRKVTVVAPESRTERDAPTAQGVRRLSPATVAARNAARRRSTSLRHPR